MARQEHGVSRRTALAAGGALAVAGGVLAAGGTEAAAPVAASAAGGTGPAATTIPWIIGCDSWGARPVPDSNLTILKGTTRKIVVHHTDYPNTTDYSLTQAEWLAKDIQRLHMDVNGWADTGQHFTVSRGGYVLEGRHESLPSLELGTQMVQGAHCVGENGQAIGIENEGTYVTETPTPMLWNSLVLLCTTICRQYNIHAYNIFGHWDWNDTDCPGAAFYREFPKLRFQVAAVLGQRYTAVPARTWPDIFSSSAGATVRTLQYLLLSHGYQVPTDAKFGATTIAAVQDWQRTQGLPPSSDGTVTQPTWESLITRLDRRSTGNPVSALQSILAHKAYPVTVNGGYDADTAAAVREMQRLHHLPPTGTVDTDTWCATLGGIVRAEFRGLPG